MGHVVITKALKVVLDTISKRSLVLFFLRAQSANKNPQALLTGCQVHGFGFQHFESKVLALEEDVELVDVGDLQLLAKVVKNAVSSPERAALFLYQLKHRLIRRLKHAHLALLLAL